METLYVIYGFLGPLMLVGLFGIFYIHHLNKTEKR